MGEDYQTLTDKARNVKITLNHFKVLLRVSNAQASAITYKKGNRVASYVEDYLVTRDMNYLFARRLVKLGRELNETEHWTQFQWELTPVGRAIINLIDAALRNR